MGIPGIYSICFRDRLGFRVSKNRAPVCKHLRPEMKQYSDDSSLGLCKPHYT